MCPQNISMIVIRVAQAETFTALKDSDIPGLSGKKDDGQIVGEVIQEDEVGLSYSERHLESDLL